MRRLDASLYCKLLYNYHVRTELFAVLYPILLNFGQIPPKVIRSTKIFVCTLLGLVVIWRAVEVSGQYDFGSTSLGPEAEATTCDEHYKDEGRACAWFTFMCEDLTTAMDSIPTCFKGAAQSPIDLNSNVATPGDPGAIVFQDFDVDFSSLPLPAVVRIQNFAMQLDFEPSTGSPVLKRSEDVKEQGKKKVSRKKQNAKTRKKTKQKQGKNRRGSEDLEENLVTPLSESPLLEAKEKKRHEWPTITGGALGSDK